MWLLSDCDSEGMKDRAPAKVDLATGQPRPVGKNAGLCQHIFALLVIEHYCGKASILPAAESLTSIPCSLGPRQCDFARKSTFQAIIGKPEE